MMDLRPKKKKESHKEPGFIVMPRRPIETLVRKSKWLIVPFVAVAVILVLILQSLSYASNAYNAQGEILGAATNAYEDLSGAGSALYGQNFADANTKFSDALRNLDTAQKRLDNFKALQLVAPQAKNADHVLKGAAKLAQAGRILTESLNIFEELKVSSEGVETENVIGKISENKNKLSDSLTLLKQAKAEFDAAGDLPGEYSETLEQAKDQVGVLSGMLENLINLQDIYIGFFGSGAKVYLLVFQNYDEVRATGGFIGTYGVIKIDNGKIKDLKIDSIYDLDGQIYDQVAAPGPFQPEIKKWGIRDANWFSDFSLSARKLLQFFEVGSQTADGVIAFTPSMFEDLLKLTGPIDMPQYGITLTSENFQEVVQYKTSVDYDRKLNEPKALLSDFAPVLLDKLSGLNKENWIELLQIMQRNLNQKHTLLFSKDPNLQEKILNLRVAGNILPAEHDYLNIVNTNLGGTKTDLEIIQKVNLKSRILSDGAIMNTVNIERQNTSVESNRNYMRIMVPLGTKLVSSTGFDLGSHNSSSAEGFKTDPDLANWDRGELSGRIFIRTEGDKTEFAGWMNLVPGESKTVTLTYVIPYKADTSIVKDNTVYSLVLQKQNGIRPYQFTASLETGGLNPYWLSSDIKLDNGTVRFDYTTGSDQYWAVLLRK